jgi:hypothetical protein
MLGGVVRRAWIAALAGVVVLVSAACGGDDDEESTDRSAATTTSAPVTTTTLDDETQKEEAAKAAYLAYWEAFERASAEPVDSTSPDLRARMTGDQARLVMRNLEEMQALKEAARRPANSRSRHQVSAAELQADGSVRITDCQVDDAVVYDTASGAVINDAVVTNLIVATMVQEGAAWKVALAERTKKWPGVVECGA